MVDTRRAEYTHEDQNRHVDYALRWSNSHDNLDWAISYFTGTDRDPAFRHDTTNNVLIPVYGQSHQTGIELQYIYRALLIKAEYLHKDSFVYGTYNAATIGFEYTVSNVGGGMDIGLLYEWLYDDRKQQFTPAYDDASFLATRLAFNDEATTELLFGLIADNSTSDIYLYRLEASRRLTDSFSLDIELNIIDKPPANSLLNQFRKDDYLQFNLSSFF